MKLVETALAVDAVALPAHWVYDVQAIKDKGGFDRPATPTLANWHEGKHTGDFTHNGDQIVWLLASLAAVAERKGAPEEVGSEFQKTLVAEAGSEAYKGYKDGALKDLLEKKEASDTHDDLWPAARVVAFLVDDAWFTPESQPALIAAARAQAKATHAKTEMVDLAEVVAKAVWAIRVNDVAIADALTAAAAGTSFEALVAKAVAGKEEDDVAFIRSVGEDKTFGTKTINTGFACAHGSAFPSAVHFALKYATFDEAVLANINCGGENSSRGFLISALLLAKKGFTPSAAVAEWFAAVKNKDAIKA